MARKTRPIRYAGDVAYVLLTRGFEAIIDAADAHLVAGHNWYARRTPSTVYAVRKATGEDGRQNLVPMHRVIVDAVEKPCVDHADGNGLNNRRSNLRPATYRENGANRTKKRASKSPYIGVRQRKNRWHAQISIQRSIKSIGTFVTAEAAARAYDSYAFAELGEFAQLNFPSETPEPLPENPASLKGKIEGRNQFIDLTGRRFGRLTVIRRALAGVRPTYWLCRCDCGHEKPIRRGDLVLGKSASCGCSRLSISKSGGAHDRD